MNSASITSARTALERLDAIPVGGGVPALDRFPDFLIAGPQRTGTTWLHHHLQSHPDIFLPNEKETYFFSSLRQPELRNHKYATLCDYLDGAMRDRPGRVVRRHIACLLRSGALHRPRVLGDATATYAILPGGVIDEIVLLNPGIKVILMLREPVGRAWSHARKDLLGRSGRRADEVDISEYEKFFRGRGQLQLARYGDIIDTWKPRLLEGHLFLGLFSDIAERPDALLRRLQQFLGVRVGRRFMDRGRLGVRINPAPGASPPPAVREFLAGHLGDARDDFARIVASLPGGGTAPVCREVREP